ncbi:hypothetical protein COO60DRAFT_512994 [Scenedesmus sp. NREL 46B-D3]|nr:hypothetical protein COO60DRAFT_512994 [Scenedesmus sp. NREL 46B-D3]
MSCCRNNSLCTQGCHQTTATFEAACYLHAPRTTKRHGDAALIHAPMQAGVILQALRLHLEVNCVTRPSLEAPCGQPYLPSRAPHRCLHAQRTSVWGVEHNTPPHTLAATATLVAARSPHSPPPTDTHTPAATRREPSSMHSSAINTAMHAPPKTPAHHHLQLCTRPGLWPASCPASRRQPSAALCLRPPLAAAELPAAQHIVQPARGQGDQQARQVPHSHPVARLQVKHVAAVGVRGHLRRHQRDKPVEGQLRAADMQGSAVTGARANPA